MVLRMRENFAYEDSNMNKHRLSVVIFALILLMAAGVVGAAEPARPSVPLVKNGGRYCVIVVADRPGGDALNAAAAMQRVMHQMTGLMLPIRTVGEQKVHPNRKHLASILIGPSAWTAEMGIDVTQDQEAGDRYVIRTAPGRVALVGNDAGMLRGTVYAVYDLLERLGCGWFGPDPVWHVIPTGRPSLTAPGLDLEVHPAFEMRWMWIIRDPILLDAWRLGGRRVIAARNLPNMLKEHRKDHPEYFGRMQINFLHPDVQDIVANKLRAELVKRNVPMLHITLANEDNPGYYHSKQTEAFGNISARKLHFVNEVARRLDTTHKGRFGLNFLTYWHTHEPPNRDIKAHPAVSVMQVNEGDHLRPWDEPESAEYARTAGRSNTRELNSFHGWRNLVPIMGIWEWWIPGCSDPTWRDVPWIPGETVLRNLRYWSHHAVKNLSVETQYEHGNGFPLRWPLYYVGAKAFWNPELTAEQIMTEACKKLFGPAAPHMLAYYQTIEKAAANSELHGENWHLPSPEKIYSPAIEAEAAKHLQAAAAAAKVPMILKRIDQEQRTFDRARKTLAELRKTTKPRWHSVILDGKTMHYRKSQITIATVRSLHGTPENVPMHVVEQDGSIRPPHDKESFDVTKGISFVTRDHK